jgi:hypothetical protein
MNNDVIKPFVESIQCKSEEFYDAIQTVMNRFTYDTTQKSGESFHLKSEALDDMIQGMLNRFNQ